MKIKGKILNGEKEKGRKLHPYSIYSYIIIYSKYVLLQLNPGIALSLQPKQISEEKIFN